MYRRKRLQPAHDQAAENRRFGSLFVDVEVERIEDVGKGQRRFARDLCRTDVVGLTDLQFVKITQFSVRGLDDVDGHHGKASRDRNARRGGLRVGAI